MSGMLFLMFVQSRFQFGAKMGNERAIMGRKIILTCPSQDMAKSHDASLHNGAVLKSYSIPRKYI